MLNQSKVLRLSKSAECLHDQDERYKKELYAKYKTPLIAMPKKPIRKIPNVPDVILDAPSVINDFCMFNYNPKNLIIILIYSIGY